MKKKEILNSILTEEEFFEYGKIKDNEGVFIKNILQLSESLVETFFCKIYRKTKISIEGTSDFCDLEKGDYLEEKICIIDNKNQNFDDFFQNNRLNFNKNTNFKVSYITHSDITNNVKTMVAILALKIYNDREFSNIDIKHFLNSFRGIL